MMSEKLKRLEVPTFETKLSSPCRNSDGWWTLFPFFFSCGKSFDKENATRENLRARESEESAPDNQLCEAVGSFPDASTRFLLSLFVWCDWMDVNGKRIVEQKEVEAGMRGWIIHREIYLRRKQTRFLLPSSPLTEIVINQKANRVLSLGLRGQIKLWPVSWWDFPMSQKVELSQQKKA